METFPNGRMNDRSPGWLTIIRPSISVLLLMDPPTWYVVKLKSPSARSISGHKKAVDKSSKVKF